MKALIFSILMAPALGFWDPFSFLSETRDQLVMSPASKLDAPVTLNETAVVQIHDNSHFPAIKIFATGGTIVSLGSLSTSNAGYSVNLTINELIDNIPELSSIANVTFQQIFNVGSNELTTLHVLTLRNKIRDALESDRYQGIVVTHGTDTLEETAFFLELTLDFDQPICLTGSMRPSTSISYDGLMNLYTAVVVSGEVSARSRGVLVTLNDRILNGVYATKSNSNSLDTFKNDEQGTLGMFVDDQINWFFSRPFKHTLSGMFANSDKLNNITSHEDLPDVIVLYAHQLLNMNHYMATLMSVKGVVLAGSGSGSWTDAGNRMLKDACRLMGIPVIYSTRNANGIVPISNLPSGEYAFPGAIASGYLNPQKARILLQLCLVEGYDLKQISEVFKLVHGGSRF